MSNLARSWPPSASPNLLYQGLQVHLWVQSNSASRFISKLARSRPPSATRSSLDLGHQVHLQTCSIAASECIAELTWLWPPSVSLSSLDRGLQVHVPTCWITTSKYIVNERRRVYRDTGVTEVDVHSIVIFICTSTCWQSPRAASPDIPCVDRELYRYIDT